MKTLFYVTLVIAVVSCQKPSLTSDLPSHYVNGIMILNEGLFQQNNASLAFYDLTDRQMHHAVFSTVNGRGLGDTANDMISFTFDGKFYYAIAVNVSSQIEILDGLSLKSIGQIGLFKDGIGRQPRSLQYANGKLYSINFDGSISVIDINTLSEIMNIPIGQNSESSIIYQNHLFAVNTGGLNFPNYDSTISVIDIETNSIITEFTAGLNGGQIIVDGDGEGYMIARGNYSNVQSQLVRIDLKNYKVIETYYLNISTMTYHNGIIYYYDDERNAILTFNTATESIDNTPLLNCETFKNVYKIIICEQPQLMYIIDANGYVNSSIIRIYNLNGDFQTEMIAGLNANTILLTP
ncbi:MAG: hypothetical protein R3279_05115 [Putridiphycobacter sp.]|nr:hypothetical protein [Putridiphycobacter sp.]